MKLYTIPKNFIINVATESGGKVISNFLIHGLCIKNDSNENIVLKEINFELYASGSFVKLISYHGQSLEKAINNYENKAIWLGEGFGAKIFLGEDDFSSVSRKT